ncbi:MAG TPA: hypothetical protein GXZ76_01725 [Clostridiaceae bacterium]|nr:hypothetical protein [Clostridiaceae bacterium]
MYKLLEGHGVIPVIKFSDVSEALPLAWDEITKLSAEATVIYQTVRG